MTITPAYRNDGNGNQALAYGVIVNIYEPHSDSYGQQLQGPGYGQDPDVRRGSDRPVGSGPASVEREHACGSPSREHQSQWRAG
jgi:hypothetical protein